MPIPFKFDSCKNFALDSKKCSKHFTLNNTYRFLIFLKEKNMHKIESIKTGEKILENFSVLKILVGLKRRLPAAYFSVLTTKLTELQQF